MHVTPAHRPVFVLEASNFLPIPTLSTFFVRPRVEVGKLRAKRVRKQSQNQLKKNLKSASAESNTNTYELSQNTDIIVDKEHGRRDHDNDGSLKNTGSRPVPTREEVLTACVTTCAAISCAGVLIQQVTHLAAENGWSVPDSSLPLTYNLESSDIGLVLALVSTVSIARQLLIAFWPEFSESSNEANKQILGPLNLQDYVVAAVLPGLSEELLFRGALLPLFGLDWKGVTVTGVVFGVLHLSGGRKNAFAMWASVVGILYGVGCVLSHSVLVPMLAHSTNNLVGAAVWKIKQGDKSANTN